MLKELKFVQGAVARKDFVQALSHFRIENQTIKGFNGVIGLCTPIELDLDVTPKAVDFAKAIQTCKDTIAIHLTAKGKLSIRSGQFKALVDCIPKEDFPEVTPLGDFVKLDGKLLENIKALQPFISDDAARPWARGVLFRGQSAFATNNIILVESWLGYNFPTTVNVPREAINELIRINEEPESLQIAPNRITFHFSGNRWLSSQTLSTEWPDLARVLSVPSNPVSLPQGLFQALEDLAPFTDKMERVYLHPDGRVHTHLDEGEGASVDLESVAGLEGCYNHKHLASLDGVAHKIDLTTYPAPCMFFGDKIRGAIVGLRK
jgi:DNA polymerase III sliding clamp (beta) subunit (PCNA family)